MSESENTNDTDDFGTGRNRSDFRDFVENNYSDPDAQIDECIVDDCPGFDGGSVVEYAEHVYAAHEFYRRSFTKFRNLIARAHHSDGDSDV